MEQIHEYEVNIRSILVLNRAFLWWHSDSCSFLLSRKSWGHISTKAFFLFQISRYMVQHLPKLFTVLRCVLSTLRMFIRQILLKFLICRYTLVVYVSHSCSELHYQIA
jgi:hypothetical protein